MVIKDKIRLLIKNALGKELISSKDVVITNSKQSDFQYSGLFQIAKNLNLDIDILASNLIKHLENNNLNVFTNKGFINIDVTPKYIEENFIYQELQQVKNSKKILVDFGGPNTAKSLHVGHLRSLVIGESIRKINRIMGHNVYSDIHIGDFGYQMGMLVYAVKHENIDTKFLSSEILENMYQTYSKLAKEDQLLKLAIKKQTTLLQAGRDLNILETIKTISLQSQMLDISKLDVYFDYFLGESDSEPYFLEIIKQLKENNLLTEDNGGYIIKFDNMAPLVIMNSEGSYLYGMTDLATLFKRKQDGFKKIIYVSDSRQELHFKQIFEIANKLKWDLELEHVGFGTVNDITGKPFKTRDGDTVKLSNLIKETYDLLKENNPDLDEETINKMVVASLKFADLSVEASKNYIFDPKKFTKLEGKTGNYILYTIARMNSILNKSDIKIDILTNKVTVSSIEEKNIYLLLDAKQEVFEKALNFNDPSKITDYIYNLSVDFNKLYAKQNIVSNQDLMWLTHKIKENLNFGLDLLSIKSVEKMSKKNTLNNHNYKK